MLTPMMLPACLCVCVCIHLSKLNNRFPYNTHATYLPKPGGIGAVDDHTCSYEDLCRSHVVGGSMVVE